MDRRRFLTASVAAGVLAGCTDRSEPAPAAASASTPGAASPTVLRIASVRTAVEGNVLPELIQLFEARSGHRVELTTSSGVYDLARQGKADLVVSHFGHRDAESFVLEGRGEWPRTVFSNQMALVGPAADPAGVRGLPDLAEAFRRIATTRSPFVVNGIDGVRYLTEILWHANGKPDRTGWLIDEDSAKDAALVRASELGAYTMWGLTPFLALDGQRNLAVEPLVLADPLLQRMLVSVVVKPGGEHAVNVAAAQAMQTFLLEPATQARIRTIHYPGKTVVSWVPAGRHNRTAVLPKG